MSLIAKYLEENLSNLDKLLEEQKITWNEYMIIASLARVNATLERIERRLK